MKELIITLTNRKSKHLVKKMNKMISDLGNKKYDFLLVFDESEKKTPEIYKTFDYIKINRNTIFEELQINWTLIKSVYRNIYVAMLKARLMKPGYNNYWYVEDDTYFNGNWSLLFDACAKDNSDFISTNLRKFKENSDWYIADTLVPPNSENVLIEDIICAFTVIYRIKGFAIDYILKKMQEGWKGHIEVLFPTLLHLNNFKMKDFGGTTYREFKGLSDEYFINKHKRFYNVVDENGVHHTTCTNSKRRIFEEMKVKDVIYHPLKK